jgi:hypothetical protein
MTDDVYAEIDAILAPVKAANPGISNGDIVDHLPSRLRGAFWDRAVDRYLAEEMANLEAKP